MKEQLNIDLKAKTSGRIKVSNPFARSFLVNNI